MSFLALRPSCQCLRSSTISPSARLSAHAFASRVTCGRRYATATSIPGSAPQTSNPKPGPPKPNSPYTIFERQVKTQQKDRAAQRRLVSEDGQSYKGEPGEASRLTDYVRTAIAENISERLLDIKRQFGTIVEIGSGPGSLRHVLDAKRMKLEKIIMCDSSEKMLWRDAHLDAEAPFEIERRVMDEEFLQFEENSLDCVVSIGALHWTNDLPGSLIQIRKALKPDGVFIGAICGGDTLFELRTSLQLAEQEREGGISARISPMAESSDMASLLSRAGFNIPTIDVDDVAVAYPSMYELFHDLRDMGESNAIINRRPGLRRDTLLSAGAIYQALHGNEDGTIPATFSVIFMIGWKPAESQPKPLKRGSGQMNLKDVLGNDSEGKDPEPKS